MISHRFLAFAFCLLATANLTFAAGGTSYVATKGQPAHVSSDWPEGAGDLVNDEARTFGLNSWFTEWPNDVNQYGYEIQSTADLNRLIEKLAAIKCELRQLRLSYLKEPSGMGWVTRLPEGNGTPVIFSIGNQARIDQWYSHVRKPFGVMEFTAAPIAVPPTLTIFVQNKAIQLDELVIPGGIEVLAGYVPSIFHKSNTTLEQTVPSPEKIKLDTESLKAKLDENSLEAFLKIDSFLEARKARE